MGLRVMGPWRRGIPFIVVLSFLGVSNFAFGEEDGLRLYARDEWIDKRRTAALEWLFKNISPTKPTLEGIVPHAGSVQAASSEENPPYRFDWTRDAALVMRIPLALYDEAKDQKSRDIQLRRLADYASFNRTKQNSKAVTGLGEPKSYLDGSPYTKDWGRPQNDGPALRVITLLRYAAILEKRGDTAELKELWDGRHMSDSMIGRDLQYLEKHWHEASFDLWEEIKGDHFYTHMVMRRAFFEATQFAKIMKDDALAVHYMEKYELLDQRVRQYWNSEKSVIDNTQNRSGGHDGKHSNLDTAIILAVLHGSFDGMRSFAADDDRVIASALKIEQKFREIYSINQKFHLGAAIGRYPEDHYYGGNPWILNTNAFAEYYFQLAEAWQAKKKIIVTERNEAFLSKLLPESSSKFIPGAEIVNANDLFSTVIYQLRHKGEDFLKISDQHSNPDGSMPEQFHRDSGAALAAPDLTWSCASAITAIQARKKILID